MKNWQKVALLLIIGALLAGICFARNDDDDYEDQVSAVTFLVIKNYNGKPLRNAAVVVHPVNRDGRQERNGIELKTNLEGRTHFDGVPYGKMRIQVLAPGFQTYGEDFNIDQPKMLITVKLKKPQEQYSIYGQNSDDNKPPKEKPKP